VYQAIIDGAVEDVKGGSPISTALERYPEIPLMVSEMISVGERSGRLGAAFGSVHQFFRRDVDDALGNLTTLLEPLVIVLIGIGVAVLLIAIIMPLYGLVQVIT
jgi:type IV pilus assembly protein PilC